MSEKEEKSLGERQFKGYWKDWDEEIYDLNQKYAKGGRLSDLLRLMMYVFWNRPIPDELMEMAQETGIFEVAQESPGSEIVAEIRELRAEMADLKANSANPDALACLEQKFDQLAHTVDQLSLKVETLQLTGGPLQDGDDLTTPLDDPNAARQASMSAKLKAIQFGKLQ